MHVYHHASGVAHRVCHGGLVALRLHRLGRPRAHSEPSVPASSCPAVRSASVEHGSYMDLTSVEVYIGQLTLGQTH